MKNIKILITLLVITTLSVSSCKKEKDHVADELSYDLTVKNTSTVDYQLYLSAGSSHEGYSPHGTIKGGENVVIKDLAVHIKYFIGTTSINEHDLHKVAHKATVSHGSGGPNYSVDIH